jgi:hypothetical protein
LICSAFYCTLQGTILDVKQIVEAFQPLFGMFVAASNLSSYPGSTVTSGSVGVTISLLPALSINTTNTIQLRWWIAKYDALDFVRGYEVTLK